MLIGGAMQLKKRKKGKTNGQELSVRQLEFVKLNFESIVFFELQVL